MKLFKRKKQSSKGGPIWSGKNNAGKIRRARVKNIRKEQHRKNKSEQGPKKVRRKKQNKKINWKKIGVVFLIVCFSLFTGWVLFFSEVMEINEIEITGYDEKKVELLQQIKVVGKKKVFNQTIEKNVALFPSEQLAEDIKKKYAIVKSVEVQKVFPNKLIVTITQRQQVFLWKQAKGCYLLDEEGAVMEKLDCGENEKELLKICHNKKEELQLDCQVIVKENNDESIVDNKIIQDSIKIEQQVLAEIKRTFYFEEDLVVIFPRQVAKEVRIKSRSHGEILFAIDKNLEKQLEKFRALLERKIDLSELESILYIDLRLDDKIIYKFKEGYDDSEEVEIKK